MLVLITESAFIRGLQSTSLLHELCMVVIYEDVSFSGCCRKGCLIQ